MSGIPFAKLMAGGPNQIKAQQVAHQAAKKLAGNTQLVPNGFMATQGVTFAVLGLGGMCIMYSVKNLAYGTNKFVIESD